MADNKYSVIREQGEFMDPVELTDEENETVVKSNDFDIPNE